MQFWSVVLFYGIAQGAVLATASIFNPRGRRAANVLLSLMLVSSTFSMLLWWTAVMGWFARAPYVAHLTVLISPAIAPLFYFYTKALLRPERRTRISVVAFWALLPGSARLAELHPLLLNHDLLVARINKLAQGETLVVMTGNLVIPAVHTLYCFVFIYLAWCLIRQSDRALSNELSAGVRRHMIWLKILTAGLCVITTSSAVMWIRTFANGDYTITTELIYATIRGLFIQSVAVGAFVLPEGFTTTLAELVVRPRRVAVDDSTAELHMRSLLEFMEREKPYRDENLRLANLAARVEIPAYVLSQLINDRLGVKYFDFINRYRVEEAQALLQKDDYGGFTLLAIAREAGFNSKASFNRAFNKHAGMSPSRYRQSYRECNSIQGATDA